MKAGSASHCNVSGYLFLWHTTTCRAAALRPPSGSLPSQPSASFTSSTLLFPFSFPPVPVAIIVDVHQRIQSGSTVAIYRKPAGLRVRGHMFKAPRPRMHAILAPRHQLWPARLKSRLASTKVACGLRPPRESSSSASDRRVWGA